MRGWGWGWGWGCPLSIFSKIQNWLEGCEAVVVKYDFQGPSWQEKTKLTYTILLSPFPIWHVS